MVLSAKRFTPLFWTESGETRFPIPTLCTRLQYAPRRLGILCPIEDGLWFSFSALFRADPCLRLLEGLEQDLRRKVQRMTVRGWLCTKN